MRFPYFAVNRTIGAGNSHPNDVVELKKALTQTGDVSSPRQPSSNFDTSISRSLKRFQTGWNLVPDAIVAPGGPTERTLDFALEAEALGGGDGMKEAHAAHNALTKAGLSFEPNPESPSQRGLWRDAGGNAIPRGRLVKLLTDGESDAGFTFDNVLRRDLVTGRHLLPGERETEHDDMTGANSPFWDMRKGPEFTKLVTRVFGGAPETAPTTSARIAASEPAQPAGQDQGGSKPVERDARSEDKSSSDAKKDEIEWVPEPIHTAKGDRVIRIKGPVKIEVQSPALGLDGLDYRVNWHPLDKDGNVKPTFRKPEGDTSPTGRQSGFSIPNKRIHQPPYDNPHGFEVRISIPPQPPRHGNTTGAHLNVFVPKGGKIK